MQSYTRLNDKQVEFLKIYFLTRLMNAPLELFTDHVRNFAHLIQTTPWIFFFDFLPFSNPQVLNCHVFT